MRKSVLFSLFLILSMVGSMCAQSLQPSPTGSWTVSGAMSQARTHYACRTSESPSGADRNATPIDFNGGFTGPFSAAASVSAVPEPGSLALMGSGLLIGAWWLRKKQPR